MNDDVFPLGNPRFPEASAHVNFPLGNPRFPEASAHVNSKHDWLRNDWLNE